MLRGWSFCVAGGTIESRDNRCCWSDRLLPALLGVEGRCLWKGPGKKGPNRLNLITFLSDLIRKLVTCNLHVSVSWPVSSHWQWHSHVAVRCTQMYGLSQKIFSCYMCNKLHLVTMDIAVRSSPSSCISWILTPWWMCWLESSWKCRTALCRCLSVSNAHLLFWWGIKFVGFKIACWMMVWYSSLQMYCPRAIQ